jgi:hypothetical protein
MPRDGALTLSDLPGTYLNIICRPCARRGRFVIRRLLAERGDEKLTDLLQMLADCPRAWSGSIHDRCKAVYEGLTASRARPAADNPVQDSGR